MSAAYGRSQHSCQIIHVDRQGEYVLTRSAIAYTVACKCAPGTIGMTLASTTRRLVVPYTFSEVSTTPLRVLLAMAAVQQRWDSDWVL